MAKGSSNFLLTIIDGVVVSDPAAKEHNIESMVGQKYKLPEEMVKEFHEKLPLDQCKDWSLNFVPDDGSTSRKKEDDE